MLTNCFDGHLNVNTNLGFSYITHSWQHGIPYSTLNDLTFVSDMQTAVYSLLLTHGLLVQYEASLVFILNVYFGAIDIIEL